MTRNSASDEIAEEAIVWFARLRADNVTRKDRERFFAWLRQGVEQQHAFVEILHLWQGLEIMRGLEIEEVLPFPPLAEVKRRIELAQS